MTTCSECGQDAVPHRTTYVTTLLDEGLKPLFAPGPITRWIVRRFVSIEHILMPLFFNLLISLKAAKIQQEPDEHTLLLAKVLWEEARAQGIHMEEIRLFNLPRNIFRARLRNNKTIFFEGIPLPAKAVSQVWWIDNKAQMKKRFPYHNIPIAKGGSAATFFTAKNIYKKVIPPVIVKPFSGSASRHTTLHIDSLEKLKRAMKSATQVAPVAVIEEELVGPVYRATVIDGKLEGVIERNPPHVIGDGTHTIEELIEIANQHPKRGGPYFSKITVTEDTHKELAWQKLSLTSIPEKGRRVTLHQKINWSLGGTTRDVTDEVHRDNRVLFEHVAEVLKAPVVGMDFIIEDMARSYLSQQRCGVIECNSMPYFDNHHLPFEGEPRNVAGAIWRMILTHKG